MNRRLKLFIIVGFILVMLTAFLIIMIGGFLSPQGFHALWQRDISHFATGFAAEDNRVFTMDINGGIVCYNAANGQTVWNGGIGGYFCSGLTANADIVCGGKPFGVGVLDASSGKSLYNIVVPIDYSNTPPSSINIIDSRVVATGRFGMGSSIAAVDATSGLLLWEALPYPSVPYFGNITNGRDWWVSGYPLEGRFLEQNSVYASIEEDTAFYIFKLETDSGNILWRASVTSLGGSVLALYQGQIIAQNGNSILSLNSASGDTVWSIDIGATIYQSTAANGLLLFGASDGNFYAIRLVDGSLAWKIPVDDEHLLAIVNSNNLLTVYPIQIDSQSSRIFYGFAITQQLGTSSETKHDQYTGYLSSIDMSTGNRTWATKFETTGVFYDNPVGLIVNKETVFLTSNNFMWTFATYSGKIAEVLRYDHYVLPPVMSEGKVFVAADLHVTAYT
jgi:outer membrane protein assembly factor BamB